MRLALDEMFQIPRERAAEAIRSSSDFDRLRVEIGTNLTRRDGSIPIPGGEYGNNLLMALLALRVKFPREEAFAKLELNISMRERRDAGAARP
jgi:hypothetical protein